MCGKISCQDLRDQLQRAQISASVFNSMMQQDINSLNNNPNHPDKEMMLLNIKDCETKLQEAQAEVSGVQIAMALAGCR